MDYLLMAFFFIGTVFLCGYFLSGMKAVDQRKKMYEIIEKQPNHFWLKDQFHKVSDHQHTMAILLLNDPILLYPKVIQKLVS